MQWIWHGKAERIKVIISKVEPNPRSLTIAIIQIVIVVSATALAMDQPWRIEFV